MVVLSNPELVNLYYFPRFVFNKGSISLLHKKKRDDRSRLVKSLTFWGHLNIQIDLGLFYVHIISVFQGYYPTFIHTQMEQNLLTL